MSREDIERIDDEGMAAWDKHDPDAFVSIFADDFVVNDVAMPEPIRDKDGARAYAQAWFTAFPDMSIKQTNRVVSDRRCRRRGRVHGHEHRSHDDGRQRGSSHWKDGRGAGHILRSSAEWDGRGVQLLPGHRRVDDAARFLAQDVTLIDGGSLSMSPEAPVHLTSGASRP